MRNPYLLPRLTQYLGGLLLCLLLAGTAGAQAPQRYTLRGRVSDAAGQGLPGANVLLAGTSFGTAANADGDYSLPVTTAPGTYTLTVSLVGYQAVTRPLTLGTEETVTTSLTLTEARQSLDEVVVVGSTVSVNKRELGNAISTIRAEDLAQSGSGGAPGTLQGKVPGAQITQNSGDPAGSISVRLHGVHSLQGSSDPLYVIDGVAPSATATSTPTPAWSAKTTPRPRQTLRCRQRAAGAAAALPKTTATGGGRHGHTPYLARHRCR